MIGVRRGVGKTRVKDDELGATRLAVDDALRVRIEVMAGFEVCADQQDDSCVRVIGAGPIQTHPQLITFAGARRANVGVRVVTVDTPRREDALRKTIFARTPHVIHDLVTSIFDDRFPDTPGNGVEYLLPTNALPFTLAAFTGALQRIKNSIGIGNLIQRRRTLRAIAPAAPRILR